MITKPEIFQKIKNGDHKAFETLFKNLYPDLCTFAFRFIKDRDTAKDLVQESFVRFWENREDIFITKSIEDYLFKSVHNISLNYLRHKEIEKKFVSKIEKELQELDNEYNNYYKNALSKIIDNEIITAINKAVSDLPDHYRIPFQLSRNDEKKASEIAIQLNLPIRTVETQLFRTLKILKEKLKNLL